MRSKEQLQLPPAGRLSWMEYPCTLARGTHSSVRTYKLWTAKSQEREEETCTPSYHPLSVIRAVIQNEFILVSEVLFSMEALQLTSTKAWYVLEGTTGIQYAKADLC